MRRHRGFIWPRITRIPRIENRPPKAAKQSAISAQSAASFLARCGNQRAKKPRPPDLGRPRIKIKPLFDCDGGVAARKARIGPCYALAVVDPG
jgi:hypothetical protein